jgi:hypothetical protein
MDDAEMWDFCPISKTPHSPHSNDCHVFPRLFLLGIEADEVAETKELAVSSKDDFESKNGREEEGAGS